MRIRWWVPIVAVVAAWLLALFACGDDQAMNGLPVAHWAYWYPDTTEGVYCETGHSGIVSIDTTTILVLNGFRYHVRPDTLRADDSTWETTPVTGCIPLNAEWSQSVGQYLLRSSR